MILHPPRPPLQDGAGREYDPEAVRDFRLRLGQGLIRDGWVGGAEVRPVKARALLGSNVQSTGGDKSAGFGRPNRGGRFRNPPASPGPASTQTAPPDFLAPALGRGSGPSSVALREAAEGLGPAREAPRASAAPRTTSSR